MEKKRIQIINNLSSGGAEKLLIDLLTYFDEISYQCDLLVLTSGSKEKYIKALAGLNIKIYWMDKFIYNPANIIHIYRFIRNYDVIHAHLFPSIYFSCFANLLYFKNKKRLIITEHNTYNRRTNNFFLRRIDKLVYKCFDKIICISPAVKRTMLRKGVSSDRLVVISNGIDLKYFNRRSYNRELKYVIGMVASLTDQKDHVTLIKSLSLLPSKIKLYIAGEGKNANNLKSLVHKLNLNERVVFLGFCDDVKAFYEKVDINVLSSNWEGFGLVAVESMAMGVPTIVSNVPGLREVVDKGGVLFEKGDSVSLANEINKLYNDRQYFISLSEAGFLKAKEYSINVMAERYMFQYNDETTVSSNFNIL